MHMAHACAWLAGWLAGDSLRTPCRDGGAEAVLLEVRASNAAALRLYESLGFQRVGLRRRYYADGEDAVLMTLALRQGG